MSRSDWLGSRSQRDLIGAPSRFRNLSRTAVTSVVILTTPSGGPHGVVMQFLTTSPHKLVANPNPAEWSRILGVYLDAIPSLKGVA